MDNPPPIPFYLSTRFLVLTIGIPFCVFKLLFGLLFLKVGHGNHFFIHIVVGWAIVLWSSIDLGMNVIRLSLDFFHKKPLIEFCLLAQVGKIFNRQSLFLTLDTLLSFSIICLTLWTGWIKLLTPAEAYFWYGATTVNLISLGIINVWQEIKH